MFQSPICRGRRCNVLIAIYYLFPPWFQSPICRGRRCNHPNGKVERYGFGFSPLFVGAGVAMASLPLRGRAPCGFSPLFVGAGVAIRN